MSDAPRWDGPPVEAWSFAWTPAEAARALEGVAAPWAVAGGWAIDLWLGEVTRPHGDLEITVPAIDFPAVRERLEGRLGLQLFDIDDGQVIALAPGEAPRPHTHQCWAMDPAVQGWRMDVFREPGDAETWVYRRTGEFTAPRAWTCGRTPDGIPYTAPQIVLLFKAKARREKDEADFARAAPRLPADARRWLADALHAIHPGHPWIGMLASRA